MGVLACMEMTAVLRAVDTKSRRNTLDSPGADEVGRVGPSGGRVRCLALPMHAPRCAAGVDAARPEPDGEVSPCFIETSARLTRAAISGGSAAAPRQLPLPSVCRARAAGSGRTGVALPALSPSEKKCSAARCSLPAACVPQASCARPSPASGRPPSSRQAAAPPPDCATPSSPTAGMPPSTG
jgi:hypothetical protein